MGLHWLRTRTWQFRFQAILPALYFNSTGLEVAAVAFLFPFFTTVSGVSFRRFRHKNCKKSMALIKCRWSLASLQFSRSQKPFWDACLGWGWRLHQGTCLDWNVACQRPRASLILEEKRSQLDLRKKYVTGSNQLWNTALNLVTDIYSGEAMWTNT